jgi:hypothetical protein
MKQATSFSERQKEYVFGSSGYHVCPSGPVGSKAVKSTGVIDKVIKKLDKDQKILLQ